MRYKKFQISGAVELDDLHNLWVTDIRIVDGSILKLRRVPAITMQTVPGSGDEDIYEYLRISSNLYQRVDKGKSIDEDYGNATVYYYILPESHPSFNFDVMYKAGYQDTDLSIFDGHAYRSKDARALLTKYLPDFVESNTYE